MWKYGVVLGFLFGCSAPPEKIISESPLVIKNKSQNMVLEEKLKKLGPKLQGIQKDLKRLQRKLDTNEGAEF